MTPRYITGFDDSDAAGAALGLTRALARAAGAEVIAAYVYPDVRPFGS
jgi:nucleotide-binding universal stress UspA family protein